MAEPKLNLPQNYLNWLDSIGEGAYVEYDDREWGITGREELLEPIPLNDDEAPYIEQAALYVKMLAEVIGETTTVDDEGNEIPYSRIGGWLTIAEDNEDLLCVDPEDDFSVWAFYPSEGGDVEKLSDSLDDFLEDAEIV